MRAICLAASAAVLLCSCESKEELGPLMAGTATVRIPAPLGIGTSGYGPFDVSGPESPFAEIYPATNRLQSHPEIRVVVISRGEGAELVFVRLDSIGVFQQLRRAIVLELRERLGRDLEHALVFGATHTHSGPGRLVAEGGLFDYIADRFFPEFYELMIEETVNAVIEAYEDLSPARVGYVMGHAEGANRNRRCEDGSDYTNASVPVIAVERDGRLDALVLSFAVHGTVLSLTDFTLSRDSPGAIEHAVEELFDHPVQVLMYTSWAGDMSSGRPEVPEQEGSERPRNYDRMDQVGVGVAEAVEVALNDLDLDDSPEIALSTFRTRINRNILDYDEDTFPHPYGALYCNAEVDCETAPQVAEGLDKNCIPFPHDQPAPDQTVFSVGRVGDLHLVTFTGEPVTSLAEYVMDGMREHDGVEDVMFFGYTQDYLGYSLLEEDWWWGGYESSGTLWGPRQGQFLADFVIDGFDAFMKEERLQGQPRPWAPFHVDDYELYAPDEAVAFAKIISDVDETYGPTDVVSFTVAGGDPWLGAPMAYLETADGEPVKRPNGQPIDSDGYYFWVDLEPDPPYGEAEGEREFRWTFNLAVTRRYGLTSPVLEGEYRLRVVLPEGGGHNGEVTSRVFRVSR